MNSVWFSVEHYHNTHSTQCRCTHYTLLSTASLPLPEVSCEMSKIGEFCVTIRLHYWMLLVLNRSINRIFQYIPCTRWWHWTGLICSTVNPNIIFLAKLEAQMTVPWLLIQKTSVVWGVAPCCLAEIGRCFRGTFCLHHQDDGPTRFNNPVDSHLHTRSLENVKSY
jgi:hypothetical protein